MPNLTQGHILIEYSIILSVLIDFYENLALAKYTMIFNHERYHPYVHKLNVF